MIEIAMFLSLFLELTNMLLGVKKLRMESRWDFWQRADKSDSQQQELANALAYGADNTSIN